ncbi:hypothetical protein MMC14_007894 [Varicellaria rhodocarpa]|nr:hypothetical protein [Varicellaria rhodocarpa]
MGKKDFTNFVDEIPDNKLQNFPDSQQTLYPKPVGKSNFRLDMQGVSSPLIGQALSEMLERQKTSTDQHNLQIQANSDAKKTSVRVTAPDTWATVLVAKDSAATPATIRASFKTSYENKTNEAV